MSIRLPETPEPSHSHPRNKLQPQQSTVWTRRMNAVCVRRARKTYGRMSNQHVILDNLNMTVPKGCIYGLLGASGCGKTTLLSCIVGRRTLNSGEIWVLGGKPGTRGSGVPGPRVGYMPQEMALYGEFTIKETMLYFGWVNGMKTDEIEERSAFLFNLLQLPGPNRYVKELSGGQQRRVSMAATFLHQPELLILDEPTVGVDPILRQSVWDYLVEITRDKTTTIIITTHYIDETKQATTIGLMRGGRFLAEDSPDEILRRYNTDSLEEAFLKLSILQNRGKRRRSSISSEIIAAKAAAIPELESIGAANEAFDNQSEISGEFGDNMSIANVPAVIKPDNPDPLPPDEEVDFSWKDMFHLMKSHHMKALIWKNLLWIWRNLPMMLFVFGIPISQISFFCWSIGHDPVGLNLAVVNREVPYKASCIYNSSCSFENMSCRYLKHLSDWNQTLVPYSSKDEAKYAVKRNWAWAYIDIPQNFSEMLALRVEHGKDASESVINGSQISIHLDMSNQQIAYLLQRQIMVTLRNFAKDMAIACNVSESMLDVPIRMNQPIYGPSVPNFTDFAAPGVMLTIVFFIAVSLTSGTMMIERDEGILERCLVSGITGLEILSAHVFTQFFVMFSQAIVTTIMALYVFNISNQGDLFWITLMMVLSGVCGMTYGFVLSSICDDFRNATYLSVGSFLPFIMLCGIIWPIQGMSKILQKISFFLPLTLSTESLRSILARGWDINHPTVYSGFIALGVWTVIFMMISVLLIKFKKG